MYKKILPFVTATALLGGSFLYPMHISQAKPETVQVEESGQEKKEWTVMGYMNGDNDLNDLVLHLIDRIEQSGSSDDINIVILYDGIKGAEHPFGSGLDVSKLFYITKDDNKLKINSKVLEDIKGEQNMGNPGTLEALLKVGFEKFPAERYMFFTMAHGNGILDSEIFPATVKETGEEVSLSISPDETSNQQMSQEEFTQAIKNAIDKYNKGKKLDVIMFFSCLMGMAEVDYSLKDVTDYTISSENVIWMLKFHNKKGLRLEGIRFDKVFENLEKNPDISIEELGKKVIDGSVEDYKEPIGVVSGIGGLRLANFPSTLSLKNLEKYDILVNKIDKLGKVLKGKIKDEKFLLAFNKAVDESQNYEGWAYRDLCDLINKIIKNTGDEEVEKISRNIISLVKENIVSYESHTGNEVRNSHGVSIFMPVYGIIDDVYSQYINSYKKSRFSNNTSWDELVEEYQSLMNKNYANILMGKWEVAYQAKNSKELENITDEIFWDLRKHILKGELSQTEKFIELVDSKSDLSFVPKDYLEYLILALGDSPEQGKTVSYLKDRLNGLISRFPSE